MVCFSYMWNNYFAYIPPKYTTQHISAMYGITTLPIYHPSGSTPLHISPPSGMLNEILDLDQLQWLPIRSDFPPTMYFMTLIPILTFTELRVDPWSICNRCGMQATNAYPSGHLVLSPFLGHIYAPIVTTSFPELVMSFSIVHLEYPLVLPWFCFQLCAE